MIDRLMCDWIVHALKQKPWIGNCVSKSLADRLILNRKLKLIHKPTCQHIYNTHNKNKHTQTHIPHSDTIYKCSLGWRQSLALYISQQWTSWSIWRNAVPTIYLRVNRETKQIIIFTTWTCLQQNAYDRHDTLSSFPYMFNNGPKLSHISLMVCQ